LEPPLSAAQARFRRRDPAGHQPARRHL